MTTTAPILPLIQITLRIIFAAISAATAFVTFITLTST